MEEIKRTHQEDRRLNSTTPLSVASSPQTLQIATTDMICFSHLRWDFVFQRPQHLLTRFARHRRVFYFEEPVFESNILPHLEIQKREHGLHRVVPHLPDNLNHQTYLIHMSALVSEMVQDNKIEDFTVWYYSPMAREFSRHLDPDCVIYDCMDELSLFRGAPQNLLDMEQEVISVANHVFTGGFSLYEAKKNRHESCHAFPSSIDFAHFAKARGHIEDPADQKDIPHPRVGFFGVIDERMDIELLGQIAEQRPDWQLVVIGPVVKIDPTTLPRHANIHYLGMKSYQELPAYLANWDLAMMPFALNESTRFISPTKTPEFLAAGKPVVSTPIRDVIRPYGEEGMVHIASTAEEFVKAAELAMRERENAAEWLERVDRFLSKGSWDKTWADMARLEAEATLMAIEEAEQIAAAASIH